MVALIVLLKIAVGLGMLAGAFCFLIPKALFFYSSWQKTKISREFSLFVNCGVWAVFFTSFVYIVAISAALKAGDYFFFGIERLVLSLLLIWLSIYFLVPKMLYFFQHWRSTRRHRDFSLSIWFAVVTLFCLSYIYLLYLPIAYG